MSHVNKTFQFNTTHERSAIMKKMRSKNTIPELLLRKALWQTGIRYRLNVKNLPGKPDIIINKYKLAIFVDGEFWHGYNWEKVKERIRSNRDYWLPKIERNMERDKENNTALTSLGYNVLRFWSKEVKKDLEGCVHKILTML